MEAKLSDADETLTVKLGEDIEKIEDRVRSGAYGSPSEVVRAGLDALEREERALDAVLKAKIDEALADSRPPVAMDTVFARLQARLDEREAGGLENLQRRNVPIGRGRSASNH